MPIDLLSLFNETDSMLIFDSLHIYIVCSDSTFGIFLCTDYGLTAFPELWFGGDRLGGAKMTFLDSNVVLKVVDSVQDNYKVQLSKYHSAFIEKKHVTLPMTISEKQQLSTSWSVYGDSLYDYVSIGLEEKLPYRSLMKIHPSRNEIDIFGVVSNTNWITQLSTTKEIKNAWYE